MTALFLMIPYIGISAYIIWHVFKLTSAISVRLRSKIFRSIFLIFFTVIATSPLTSFLIASGPLHFLLKKLNNIWLGFMLYIILILAVMDAVILILRLSKKNQQAYTAQPAFCHPHTKRRPFAGDSRHHIRRHQRRLDTDDPL